MDDALARRMRAAAATDQPFAQARTLPGFVHHDTALFEHELNTLFRSWTCVAHIDSVRREGATRVVVFGNESIILTRDKHGTLQTFLNVCRHRGTRLLGAGESHCRHLVCPYHAWRYATDGALTNAPGMPADFAPGDHSLVSVRHAELHGFIFVSLDQNGPSLHQHFADFPALNGLAIDTLVRGEKREYTVNANWKLIGQNFNECYHCAGAHPQLHRLSKDGDLPGFDHRGAQFTGGPMRIELPHQSLTVDGKTARPPLGLLAPNDDRLAYYFHLFPNLLLSIAPDYVMAHYLFPASRERTVVQTEWFFAPDVFDAPDFDGSDAVEFWEQTNQQDFALCENAHAGLASDGHIPGPYHPLERCVHDFDRWYLGALTESATSRS